MTPLRFVIISGLSGSGKTTAIKVFEDMGFFCVDNLPPALITTFAALCSQAKEEIRRIALGVDIRARGVLGDLPEALRQLEEQGHRVDVLFLEARDEVLIRRYSETRRRHPLDTEELSVVEAIQRERHQLADLRNMATKILDSSEYTIHQLREVIRSW
ncbi:MAG: RNase adapter RapZ, partial [Nitrospinota bacterium]